MAIYSIIFQKKRNDFITIFFTVLFCSFSWMSLGQNKTYTAGTTVYDFISNGIFSGIPVGTVMKIECYGGGGGGGGVKNNFDNANYNAGGGGGGAYAFANYTYVTGGNLVVTVGLLGAAGSDSGGNGGNGTESKVGSIVEAGGGKGGAGALSSGQKSGGDGGIVGSGIGFLGGKGGSGWKSGSYDLGGGGGGGAGPGGNGGVPPVPTGNGSGGASGGANNGGLSGGGGKGGSSSGNAIAGSNGINYGGGGGGGSRYNSGKASGGKGAPGFVRITIIVPTNTISTSSITGSPFCPGTSISVPYTISGTFTAGNIFTAQLSNASGSFTNPTNIGTVTSTAAGTISATIPVGTGAGTGYRIRVVSNNPAVTGSDNGANLTIILANGTTQASGISLSSATLCLGQTVTATRYGSIGTGRDVWWMRTQGALTWDVFEEKWDVNNFSEVLNTPGIYEIYHHPFDQCAGWNGWTLGTMVTVIVETATTPPTSIQNCPNGTLTATGGSGGDVAWSKTSCGTGIYVENFNSYSYGSSQTTVNSSNGGILNLTSTNGDPNINMPAQGSFDPTIYRYINIRYKVLSGPASSAEIFYYNGSHGAVGGASASIGLVNDNTWHTATIDMLTGSNDYLTGGNITGWRYDWTNASGVNMLVDFIIFSQFPMGSTIQVTPTTTPETYFAQRISNCTTTTCISTTVISGPSTTVSIPYERTDFSTQTVTGWSSNYTTPALMNATHDCKGLPAVFNAVNQYAWVNYNSNATKLSYSLKLNNVGANTREVVVEQSVDGCVWNLVASHTPVSSVNLATEYYVQNINADSRHIRFRMTAQTAGRIELDNVKIYNITIPYPTALSANTQTQTCAVYGNHWVHFYAPDNTLIAAVNANATDLAAPSTWSNNNLGDVTLTSYVGAPGTMFACLGSVLGTNPLYETAYMGRNWVISSTIAPTTIPVSIRLPFTDSEMTDLTTKATGTTSNPNDNVTGRTGLIMSKYSGPIENAIPQDNCGGGTTLLKTQVAGGNGVANSITDYSSLPNAQYVTFNVSSFSELYLHGNTNSPLPVTLTNFSATCDKNVVLNWSTASEQNSDQFIVEKSRDLQTWSLVGTQTAAGSSNMQINYNQLDENKWNGIAYYRLRQIDFNGEQEIYGPISVSCGSKNNSISVYPNPSQGSFTVEIQSEKEMVNSQIQLLDMTSRVIEKQKINTHFGTTQIIFNLLNLQQGTYLIQLISDSDNQEQIRPIKVMIKK